MNSVAPRVIKKASLVTRSQTGCAASSIRFMSDLGDTWNKKVKVEEDRFMARRDAAYLQRTRNEIAVQKLRAEKAAEELFHHRKVLPLLNQLKGLLGEDSKKMSDDSLKKIAYWKIGN